MLKKINGDRTIIIKKDELDKLSYYSIEDLQNAELDKVFSFFRLNKFVKRYIIHNGHGAKRFYKKEDIERLLEYRKELTSVNELCAIYGLNYQPMYDWIRINKFRYITTLDHPYIGNAFVYSEDLQAIRDKKEKNSEENRRIRIFDGKEYVTIKEASKIAGFKIPKSRRKDFNSYIVVGSLGYVRREEAEQFKPYSRRMEFVLEGKKYIAVPRAEKMLGLKLTDSKREKLKSYIVTKNLGYVKIDEIKKLIKLKESTVSRLELEESMGLKNSNRVISAIDRLGIKTIKKSDNFYSEDLLYKKDVQKIVNHVNYRLDLENALFERKGIKLYRLYTRDITVKKEIRRTISLYDDYVICRFENNFKTDGQQKRYARIFSTTYQILLDTFNMDIEKYKEDAVDEMVKWVSKNTKYSQNSREELVRFMNHIIKVLNLNWNSYVFRLEDALNEEQKKNRRKKEYVVYSQEQYLKLWEYLHCNIKNKEYLRKAIADRLAAQRWLYMYLHFSTLWRSGDIFKIPSPNLSLLNSYGIIDGESFFKWLLDDKNTFTDEMGMIMTESVKGQVKAFKIKIRKTNQNLFIEVGRLMSPVLGLLLAICEAHRQVAMIKGLKNYRTDFMLTVSIGSSSRETFIDTKVREILNENFNNIKANKAFNNYIHNYSEETQNAFASHMISILRGYRDEVSETTTIYETRKADGTIDKIVATLFDRGTFAFAKFLILSQGDKNIKKICDEEQTNLIKSFDMTPLQTEIATKNIFEQSERVINLFAKMRIEPNVTEKIFEQLAFGNSYSKHNHARCLLKAMLNAGVGMNEINNVSNNMSLIEQLKDSRSMRNCIYPNTDTCFGCRMLIAEMYFLYEINQVMFDAIKRLELCDKDNKIECYMYSNLILKCYLPILREAMVALGKGRVNAFVDIEGIRDKVKYLQHTNKIILKLQGGDLC